MHVSLCNHMLTLISIATLYTKIMFDVRILLFLLVCSISSEGTRDLRDNGFSSFNNKHVEFQHINYINFVKWTDEGTLLKNGYCATFKDSDRFFTARCPYFSIGDHTASRDDPSFIVLPKNSSELDDYMCKPMNRKGYLCKECIDGFAPSFTSPDYMSCSNCTKSSYYGVPIYILIELIPITFFYLLLLVLQVSVTSSPMTCYIFYSQIIMYIMVPSGRSFFLEYDGYLLRKYYNLVVIFAFYGVWNLDFLRYSLPKFCISPKVDQTQITLLGFISVFYPLLLILLTWTLVTLHDRNVKVIVHFWRPFHKIFVTIRRQWDSRSDLINVFATFLLLSYGKLFYVVMNFTYTTVYIVNSTSEDAYASGVVQFINIKHVAVLVGLIWGLTQLPVIFSHFLPLEIFQKVFIKV